MKTKRKTKPRLVEIARSFGYKLNAGNYETRDFFCSQKAECRPQEAEDVSDALYQFCKAQVIKAVNGYIEEMKSAKPAEKPKVGPMKSAAEKKDIVKDEAEHDAGQMI